jgi:hypothetical protein
MRTTLNIPDDIYDVLRSFAQAKGLPLGSAAGLLIRRALAPQERITDGEYFPSFRVTAGAAPISLEQTLAAEDEA